MGEFTLSGGSNLALGAVDSAKTNSSGLIYFTTPNRTGGGGGGGGGDNRPASMQDETAVSAGESEPGDKKDDGTGDMDKCTITSATLPSNGSGGSSGGGGNSDLNPTKTNLLFQSGVGGGVGGNGADVNTSDPPPPLWSTGIEDSYVSGLANVNSGLGFQSFAQQQQQQQQQQPHQQHQQQQHLYNHGPQQGRRAITASHNFPHNITRPQPLFKSYNSWANPGQSWSSNASAWNRGRSVPNLTPLQQQMSVANRKPSPTFNHQQQVISPVKFRRSTSYPGKGPFPQPPTFEITNMDEPRELLQYQVMTGPSNPLPTCPIFTQLCGPKINIGTWADFPSPAIMCALQKMAFLVVCELFGFCINISTSVRRRWWRCVRAYDTVYLPMCAFRLELVQVRELG